MSGKTRIKRNRSLNVKRIYRKGMSAAAFAAFIFLGTPTGSAAEVFTSEDTTLDNLIHSDVSEAVYNMTKDEITVSSGEINQTSLTINGGGHSIKESGLIVGQGKTLTINNVGAFTKAADGTITITNSGFRNFGSPINNFGTISSINDTVFTKNATGAINNKEYGTISNIDNVIITNNKQYGSTGSLEAQIVNDGIINNISGSFTENSLKIGGGEKTISSTSGVAIHNDGTIDSISGNFTENKAEVGSNSTALGGAIYNNGTINSISGNFAKNKTEAKGESSGGAIYNKATINTLYGDFSDNSANMGGAISNSGDLYNSGKIGNINANFTNNRALFGNTPTSTSSSTGTSNRVQNHYYYTKGGAIHNSNGSIENISGKFEGNTVGNLTETDVSQDTPKTLPIVRRAAGDPIYNYYYAYGGAINNDENSYIGTITADFINNKAKVDPSKIEKGGLIKGVYTYNYGGAVSNSGTIDTISGNFSGNSADQGGAIYNYGTIDTISSNFSGNSANRGGAIYNDGTIDTISSNFSGNSANRRGVIYNDGTIDTISSNFSGNSANLGGAIYNSGNSRIEKAGTINFITESDFSGNSADYGGAIYNSGTIDTISSNFSDNSANLVGGAIYNDAEIRSITNSYFSGNYSYSGGAINNIGMVFSEEPIGSLIQETDSSTGETVYGFMDKNMFMPETITKDEMEELINEIIASNQNGKIRIVKINENSDITTEASLFDNIPKDKLYNEEDYGIINSNFIGNYVMNIDENSGEDISDYNNGGAIFTTSDLNIIADNGVSVFKDNYVEKGNGEKDSNAIYVLNTGSKTKLTADDNVNLNLIQRNSGKMYMYDNIYGKNYSVNIKGDGTGTFYMYNDIKNAAITFDNTTINTVNDQIHTYNFNSLNLASNTNFVADVDLQKETMDRITTGNNYNITNGAKLTVSGMHLLNDANKDNTVILFAESGLAPNVNTTVKEVAYSPIYKYNVNYAIDDNDQQGYFTFARSVAGGSNNYQNYNPSVYDSAVTTSVAATGAMNAVTNYAFEHADTFFNLPTYERMAQIYGNRYAMSGNDRKLAFSSTPYNENLGHIDVDHANRGIWFKPYAVFENVPLRNGPKVDAITYGTLIGYDSDFHLMKHGWAGVTSGYIGYNGAQLDYANIDASTNGGLLGVTQTFYRKNFFTALTLTAGAQFTEAHTMYGKDDMTTLMAGIASKSGYNFEFKGGKFIIQPLWAMSYSFANTFDYTNAAGVKINMDPLHTIQLHPAIRFISNVRGWQPYATVGMVWNLMNETKGTADNEKLPEMHVKPYVEYGVGLQKCWDEKYSAYGQAVIRNGGRNGIALTLGFRMALGKDISDKNKVAENVSNPRTIVKSSTMGTISSTSKFSHKKVVKVSSKNGTLINIKNTMRTFIAKMDGEPLPYATTITKKHAVIVKI